MNRRQIGIALFVLFIAICIAYPSYSEARGYDVASDIANAMKRPAPRGVQPTPLQAFNLHVQCARLAYHAKFNALVEMHTKAALAVKPDNLGVSAQAYTIGLVDGNVYRIFKQNKGRVLLKYIASNWYRKMCPAQA